ncbi:MAG: T9SS type A sorting domain-containing protein [Bacteroidetes bacterium]|nr:MAG: T9SS type A sorting domain-containing protein [Bacteroidota bacterium]
MRVFLSSLFLLTGLWLHGQAQYSPQAKRFAHELKPFLSAEAQVLEMPKTFAERYDLYFKRGSYHIGALLQVAKGFDRSSLNSLAIELGTDLVDVLCVRVPVQHFAQLQSLEGVMYIEAGSQLAPELDRSRYSTRADSVHLGVGLQRAYTGKGVIVAIIDWGFDYTHPTFYDSSGTVYRVSRAWDQNKNSGPAPQGFDFGTEYVGKDALLAAEQDTLYVFGPGSHGTHVGGIAGGSGGGTKYYGIAPEAELVFISLKRDDPSFIDAITYISRYADAAGKPFVVNMSFGNHSGPHDGSTLRNRALDILAGQGKVFIASAGNNGNEFFHLQHDFQSDTLKSVVYFATGLANYWGETVNAWGTEGEQFEVSLALADNNDSIWYQSPYYSTSDNLVFDSSLFAQGNDSLFIRYTSDANNLLNNKPNLQFEAKKSGFLKLVMFAKGSGNVHFWHIAQLNNRVTNWGQPFRADFAGAVAGDPNYGIGGPPAVSKEVTTIASHRGEVVLPNGQVNLGQLSTFSSFGPTADERTKPDISGPGQDVASSVNSFDPGAGSAVETISFNGKDYTFVRYSGTSMSGPAVAGIVALMLEANPKLTAKEVKQILKETARLDQHTGQIGPEGDLRWGWGKADAQAAIQKVELKLQVKGLLPQGAQVYPNPSSDLLYVEAGGIQHVAVYDLSGRELNLLFSDTDKGKKVDVSSLAAGVYVLQWRDGNGSHSLRIMVK